MFNFNFVKKNSIEHRDLEFSPPFFSINFTHPAIKSRIQVKPSDTGFNNGFYVMRLDRWRKAKMTDQLEDWMKLHERYGNQVWKLGTQPPMQLALYGKIEWIDDFWNFPAKLVDSDERVRKSKIIHWHGPVKPWKISLNNIDTTSSRIMGGYGSWWRAWRLWIKSTNEFVSSKCHPKIDLKLPSYFEMPF